MSAVPKTHPRAKSLLIRERLASGFERGLVAKEGLMAHGRGEAFDYLIGEKTTRYARSAIKAAAASMLLAQNPVISVNGNLAALCPKEVVNLSYAIGAMIEVNIFYDDDVRRRSIIKELKQHGARQVLGAKRKRRVVISGLDSARKSVDADGIYSADTVLVPLEDGDRTEALVRKGKNVVTIDLNPLSRTAQKASITIVDNVTRCLVALEEQSYRFAEKTTSDLQRVLDKFDNKKNLHSSIKDMRRNLAREWNQTE